jgi:hypothetical protein
METQKRKWAYFLLSALFCFVAPIILFLVQFDFFKKETSWVSRITTIGLILVFVLLIKFSRFINDFIKTIKKVIVRQLLLSAKNLLTIVIAILVLEIMKTSINDLQVLIGICGVSFIVGNWFFEYYREEIKIEDKQEVKNSTIEAVLVALKEDRKQND